MENIKKPKKRSLRFLSVLTVVLLLAFMAVPAFAAENAVVQKEISGKWRFNDYLAPISGLQESVNFTAMYSFEYQGTHSGTVSCSGLSFIEGDGYAFLVRSMFNGLSDPTDQTIAESFLGVSFPFDNAIYKEYMNGDDYGFTFISQGFDFQTIDFGTSPQYVSVDFYNWLIANAVPVNSFRDSVSSGLTVVIEWVGTVVSSLFSGELSGLLPIVAIPVAVTLLVLAIYFIRRSIWGA